MQFQSTHPEYEMLGKRAAIGIAGTGFVLSEADYWELYQFSQPADYDDFRGACDQVKAKWPPREMFDRLAARDDDASA